MSEEWEERLRVLINEGYDIEDLVGVCRIARGNGFVAGRESFQRQVKTRILLAQERVDEGRNVEVNQVIIGTLTSLIV